MVRRSCLLVLLLLAGLSLAACGGGGQGGGGPDQDGSGSDQQSNGAPGAPQGQGGDAEAIGAPIKIPAFGERGIPISVARPHFEDAIRQACPDGTLCLNVEVEPADADPAACSFDRIEPAGGTEVERGSTVVMVCTPSDTTESSEPPTSETDQSETSTT